MSTDDSQDEMDGQPPVQGGGQPPASATDFSYDDRVSELVSAGASQNEIASELGISRGKVRRTMARLGLTSEQAAELEKLRAAGTGDLEEASRWAFDNRYRKGLKELDAPSQTAYSMYLFAREDGGGAALLRSILQHFKPAPAYEEQEWVQRRRGDIDAAMAKLKGEFRCPRCDFDLTEM